MAENATNNGLLPAVKRGKSYTKVEDLLNCRAFIMASEDAVVGTSQKGREFKSTHHKEYVRLLDQQEKEDQTVFDRSSESYRSSMGGSPPVYHRRTPDSVYTRFKDVIASRTMKFIGIEQTTDKPSGTTDDEYFDLCNATYQRRYPSLGNFADFRQCKEYLADSPKFFSYKKMVEDEAAARKARPKGRDKTKRKEADEQLAKKVLENEKSATAPPVSVQNQVIDLISDLGGNMLQQWSQESDVRFAEMLPDRQKREWCAELFEIKMLEAQVKKRKLREKLQYQLTQDSASSTSPSSTAQSQRTGGTSYDSDESEQDDDSVLLSSLANEEGGGFLPTS